jgi:cold shock CspA family protein
MTAIVFSYFPDRRFGFLRRDDGCKDIFFHASNYFGAPKIGTHVTFDIGEPTKLGQPPQAVNVRVVEVVSK